MKIAGRDFHPRWQRVAPSARLYGARRALQTRSMSALASSARLDVRIEASWPAVDDRIDGWWALKFPLNGDAA
jgi:hypothetical protein